MLEPQIKYRRSKIVPRGTISHRRDDQATDGGQISHEEMKKENFVAEIEDGIEFGNSLYFSLSPLRANIETPRAFGGAFQDLLWLGSLRTNGIAHLGAGAVVHG